MGGETAPPATTNSSACLTSRVKWLNHLYGYGIIIATDNSGNDFVHFPSAATTSPPLLRDGEVVSFSVALSDYAGASI